MNYLQRKRYALMMNRKFRGTLITVTGNPATLPNCRNDYPVNMTISGNTYQGNPDDNYLDILDVWDNPDGTLWSQYKYKYIKLKPNTAYTLSTNAPLTTSTSSGNALSLFCISSGKRTSNWYWTSHQPIFVYGNNPKTWCTDADGYLTIMLLSSGGEINCTRENLLDGTHWVMLNEGETALEYKPYVGLLSSTNPHELQNCGDMTVNLADQANVYKGTNNTNMVPYPNRTSKGYILDNSINRISLIPCKIEEGKTYTINWNEERITGELRVQLYTKNLDLSDYQYIGKNVSFVARFDANCIGIYVQYAKGETDRDTGEPTPLNQIRISEVMLNEGDTALPYEPYGQYKIPVEQSGNLYNVQDRTDNLNNQTYWSVDEDDYITVEFDNSSGTGTRYPQYFTNLSDKIKPNRLYTVITEIKEISEMTLNVITIANTHGQFKTAASYTSSGTYKSTVVSKEDVTSCLTMLRTETPIKAGKIGKAVFRISIFEGEITTAVEDFVYQPYCDEVKKYNIYVPKQLCGGENRQKVFSSDIVKLDLENKKAILTKKFADFTIDAETIYYISNNDKLALWCTHEYGVLGKEVCCFRLPNGSIAMVNGKPKAGKTVVCSHFSGKLGSPWMPTMDMANKMTERMLSITADSGLDFCINYDTIGFPLYGGVESLPQEATDGQLARVNVDGEYLWYKYSEADATWVESEYVIGVKGDLAFRTAMETAFKAWLTDNNITINGCYELNEYEEIDISDIQDWDSISKLNKGINVITIESTERPSNVEVSYYT